MTLGSAFGMIDGGATGIGGALFLVAMFFMFFTLSCIILIIMEGVSAMLHSLRLAWVESFSKFAEFAGWPFAPFSFKQMLEESEDLTEYIG